MVDECRDRLHRAGWSLGEARFGGTWLVNRWVKVQVNAIRQSFVDETGIRPEIPQARWRSLMRLQFAM